MTDELTEARIKLRAAHMDLNDALGMSSQVEGVLITQLLEQSARLLQDLDALQSAVKSDKAEADHQNQP